MRKMLIAVHSQIVTKELVRTFQSDFEIHTCSDGDDAVHLLQRIKPEVLIVMYPLPGITGMEVLKQMTYTPPVILALTTFLSDRVVMDAQAAGVGALIRLPCTILEIESALNKLLNKQAMPLPFWDNVT